MPVIELLLIFLIVVILAMIVLQAVALRRRNGMPIEDAERLRMEADARMRDISTQLVRAQTQAERAELLDGELKTASEVVSAQRATLAGKTSELVAAEKNLQQTAGQLTTLANQHRELLDKHSELLQSNVRLEQEIKSAKQRESETTTLLAGAKEEMAREFKLLAGTLLEEKGAKLTEQQKNTLATLLDPFNETLKDFKGKVEAAREADVGARAGLLAQILELTKLNQDIGAKAQSLTNALRGESKTRGIWGEAVLQRILELAGLREGETFRTQVNHQAEDNGGRLIPDVVLDLPQDRAVVIDAKVSLIAYERYVSAMDDELARASALVEHAASIKRHINDLSKKNYPSLYQLKTVDFTLLFVPIESALMAASEADPLLAQYALERHIALVSPNTLFTVLRTIEYIWRVDKTTRNMEDIVKRGGLMYDAAVRFSEHVIDITDALEKATSAAQAAEKALVDPSRGLVRQAEQLRALGIKTKKTVPKRLSSNGNGTESAALSFENDSDELHTARETMTDAVDDEAEGD